MQDEETDAINFQEEECMESIGRLDAA